MMRARSAIKEIAKREGKSIEEIRAAIQESMDAAMASQDPAVQDMWKKIPCVGEKPTPEEFIEYVARKVALERKCK